MDKQQLQTYIAFLVQQQDIVRGHKQYSALYECLYDALQQYVKRFGVTDEYYVSYKRLLLHVEHVVANTQQLIQPSFVRFK